MIEQRCLTRTTPLKDSNALVADSGGGGLTVESYANENIER